MNPQEAKEFVRQACIRVNADITKFQKGCKFRSGTGIYEVIGLGETDGQKWYTYLDSSGLIGGSRDGVIRDEVIGRDIRLADVVLALESKKCVSCNGGGGFAREGYEECGDCGGTGYHFNDEDWDLKPKDVCDFWDMTKSFDDQSDETVIKLAEMLK